ncbi:carboxylating nicotinate-nucleotide diphosphorylase [Desulforhopalus vacuolatus]|uniref:carboxylating nicotinate-nucleotide diphosphorylase n=1 Tax=Desulforhopalus vacuolatus TaxID=40414 RepID=UPI001962BF63|nr:carboxylating nicotinate-nucleotide diphosphorylase [Desulforhopalus vacuolatus]MBM9520259.1 carboxylating nicotinate-nucleotide diphosphorylase [Desulforhopalus vacuolatus]
MQNIFDSFFSPVRKEFLRSTIRLALKEDGQDLTSEAVFDLEDMASALIMAKEDCVLAGLPVIPIIFEEMGLEPEIVFLSHDGDLILKGQEICRIKAPARKLLKAERVIMNFLCHLSGIATLTRTFVQKISGYSCRILDTRKTLPGLRFPEKYAVLTGGGTNHRLDLEGMLMLKDNHLDRAGGILPSVQKLRETCVPCPPIEVECRNMDEVAEAIKMKVDRIMLDNMSLSEIREALTLIPQNIESELSGGVDLHNIEKLAALNPDYISCGALTHSARFADLSMVIVTTNG